MATNRVAAPADPVVTEARTTLDSLYINIAKAKEDLASYKSLEDSVKKAEDKGGC